MSRSNMADSGLDSPVNLSWNRVIFHEKSCQRLEKAHKQKKALMRKQRRKLQRQALAKEREKMLEEVEEAKQNSPTYLAKLEQDENEVKLMILQMEEDSRRQRELWEWSEEVFKERLKQKKEQEERERLNKIEIERKIKEEWEERQRQEKEEEEERQKKKEKQEEMLRQARQGENKDGDWHNPLAPVQYGQERIIEPCPFFAKVGACRFGDRCSRGHPYPERGRTILFTNMFRHFQLDQGLCEEYDTDIVLEYEDSEVNQKFSEFYEDTLPEFKNIGDVIQFKVSCNFQPHLRGNVYVSYTREEDAMNAFTQFNARWYAGKQISGQIVDIPSWKRAICGLFGRGRCPKGRECNFLHVFKNPNREFSLADRDQEPFTPKPRNAHYNKRADGQSFHQNRSPSRSNRRQSSRSSDRYRSSSRRSHSRDRLYNRKDQYRSSSRYSRSKSKERTEVTKRSRSRERSRSYKRSKSRDRSDTYKRSRSRSIERKRHQIRERSISREKKRKSKHKQSRSQSNSPKKAHKHMKKTGKIRSRENSSDEETCELEEVWVERTVDRNQRNGT